MLYARLGEMLADAGYITPDQLQAALEIQKNTPGKKTVDILMAEGFVDRDAVCQMLEGQLGVTFADLGSMVIPRELSVLVSQATAKKYHVIPVKDDGITLHLAMADPLNYLAADTVRMTAKRKVIPMLAAPEAIEQAITNLYSPISAEKALQDLHVTPEDAPSDSLNIIGPEPDAAPTIRLVNSFLEYAVNQNASDIHLEPREGEMAVRMRLDGLLRQVFTVPRATRNAVIARIKVMGNMDIAEHKVPLDGRCHIRIGEKDVDLRISTLPTVHGEKAVIRLLQKSDALLSAEGIGLTGRNLEKFHALLESRNGVILIAGPTGSGKSSTMYTMIDALNTEQVNLVTLEDPVEYHFDGVNQVQINEKTGMTFASGLRSILRQDPDIIAVGEIRDSETADIAMRSAITGHLVLSTLHTNDAPGTIDRLLDMGVEQYLIASALKGVIAQRLVRRICPHCREEYTPTREEQQKLQLPFSSARRFSRGRGCPRCFHTGYRGRTAVFEILIITPELRRAIADGVPRSRLAELIQASDYTPLLQDCVRLVETGVTTAEEVHRTIRSALP